MIYVDKLFTAFAQGAQASRVGARNGHKWCHMWCEPGNEAELHRLAAKIGMRRAWFQNKPGFPHYDLVPAKRSKAIQQGAKETDLKAWLLNRRKNAQQAARL